MIPQYTGPDLCLWGLRTNHNQAVPGTDHMYDDLNSSELEREKI